MSLATRNQVWTKDTAHIGAEKNRSGLFGTWVHWERAKAGSSQWHEVRLAGSTSQGAHVHTLHVTKNTEAL